MLRNLLKIWVLLEMYKKRGLNKILFNNPPKWKSESAIFTERQIIVLTQAKSFRVIQKLEE